MLQKLLSQRLLRENFTISRGNISCKVDCKKAKLQSTQSTEYRNLLSGFRNPPGRSGINGPPFDVVDVQCGWFGVDDCFNLAATWNPIAPFNKLWWYGDSKSPKFEVGISYEKNCSQNELWTGQWIDFPAEAGSRDIAYRHTHDQRAFI